MSISNEILKVGDQLQTARLELSDALRNQEEALPRELKAAESAALSGDREALQELVLLRERLALSPGVVVRLRAKVDRLEHAIQDLGQELLSQIRAAAREKLEQLQIDFMAQQDGMFGGSLVRTREALKGVLLNCEARRWRDELPRDLSSYGPNETLAPRLIHLRDAFQMGKSLSVSFKETQQLEIS